MKIILVIDDELSICELLRNFLTQKGYQVHIAEGGKEGIRLLESDSKYDAVITDIQMPEINGNFIAKHIRASEKEHTPILAITGTPNALFQSQFFDLVIKKPFKLKKLQKALNSLIN